MGLADLLIYCEKEYGSEEGNALVDEIFKTIAVAAYEESVELATERGSFPFLEGQTEAETARLREAFINTGFMKKCHRIFAKILWQTVFVIRIY